MVWDEFMFEVRFNLYGNNAHFIGTGIFSFFSTRTKIQMDFFNPLVNSHFHQVFREKIAIDDG